MESMASSSTSNDHHLHQHQHQTRLIPPAQPVVDRIIRAIRHPLLLLHRSESNFFVLGATGNVYTVTLSATPTCTCPDRTTPCKHILFILIRVLGVSLDDSCLRRRNLRPCRLNRLLSTPVQPESLASANLRERFHQLFFRSPRGNSATDDDHQATEMAEEGTTCPVCLEEIVMIRGESGRREKVVACGTCRNLIHEECLLRWKRSRGRRGTICVICRARWRRGHDRDNNNNYLNLAAYLNESSDEEIRAVDEDDDDDGGAATTSTTSGAATANDNNSSFCDDPNNNNDDT